MTNRFVYEVSWANGDWNVFKDGKTVVKENGEYAHFDRKRDAVDFAREEAKKSGFSKLKILNKNRDVVRSHKYGSNPTPKHRR